MRAFGEASYDETAMAMGGNRANKDDDRLFVQFSMQPHPDQDKSAQEGRPIFTSREYVLIMVPGDKESIVHRPVWRRDIERFASRYRAFKEKQEQSGVAGTPLTSVSFITREQVKELEYFNCYTVEQLAGIADTHASKFMGLQKMKQLANDFLVAAKETAPLTAMRAEMDKKDQEMAAQKQALDDQASRIKSLEDLVNKMSKK